MRLVLSSLALVILLPFEATAAAPTGFQIRLEGLASAPLGSYPSLDAQASDLFAAGPGFVVTPTVGVGHSLFAGIRVGYFSSGKTGTVEFPHPSGAAGLPDPSEYQIRRRLGMVPIHALIQYRRPLSEAFGLDLDLGAGLNNSNEKVTLSSTIHLFEISGYQKSFSALLGANGTYAIGMFDLTAGLSYEQLVTDDGDIWLNGDNPKFFSITAGVRYPR